VLGQWELDRGDQYLAYYLWWHIAHDGAVTSERATPSMIEAGIVPELLLGRQYGHRQHSWDLRRRRLLQTIDLGDQHQMVPELRPAHDPTRQYGVAGVVVSVDDLSASIGQLAGWSFVVSSAHGAGPMPLPVFVSPLRASARAERSRRPRGRSPRRRCSHRSARGREASTCGAVALLVYEVVGLGPLRRRWFNVDRVWTFALVGAGAATLLTA
jgi:hypothetical protein